jgi:hypothetical protein
MAVIFNSLKTLVNIYQKEGKKLQDYTKRFHVTMLKLLSVKETFKQSQTFSAMLKWPSAIASPTILTRKMHLYRTNKSSLQKPTKGFMYSSQKSSNQSKLKYNQST